MVLTDHAVLISAGIARRMYPLTLEKPKCLIEVVEKKTILDFQIESLILAGFKKITMIVGYKMQMIIDHLNSRNYDITVEFIFNPFYEVSNNLASLWLALQHIEGSIVTINGDDLFNSSILSDLDQHEGDIVLTISQKDSYDEDDMKILMNSDNRLLSIGKEIELAEAQGESIGIIKYSELGLNTMREKLTTLLKTDHYNKDLFYLFAIQELINDNFTVELCFVEDNCWWEFDYPGDLEEFQIEYSLGNLNIK